VNAQSRNANRKDHAGHVLHQNQRHLRHEIASIINMIRTLQLTSPAFALKKQFPEDELSCTCVLAGRVADARAWCNGAAAQSYHRRAFNTVREDSSQSDGERSSQGRRCPTVMSSMRK
jgi:hypothetical protein